MINKGIISVLCAFTTASTVISIGNAFSDTSLSEKALYYNEHSDTNESCQNLSSEYKYVLKEYNGKIAVFDVKGKICETFDVSLITLPASEQEKLKNGIQVKNESELNALREAYCS